MAKLRYFNIRISEEMYEKLDMWAAINGCSKTDIIRSFIDNHIDLDCLDHEVIREKKRIELFDEFIKICAKNKALIRAPKKEGITTRQEIEG